MVTESKARGRHRRARRARAAVVPLIVGVVLFAGTAGAQSTPTGAAPTAPTPAPVAPASEGSVSERAEKLFAEASALANDGRFVDACPKFAESQKLDPALGTQYNLALCYEKLGRLGSAWRNHRAVDRLARAAGKSGRAEAARAKMAELRPRVPHFVFTAEDPNVTISVDGERVERDEWEFVALDVGEHVVDAAAPAKKPWQTRVSISLDEGGAERPVAVPRLETAQEAVVVAAPKETSNTRRTLAFVAAGIGVVGAGAAAVTGIMILGDKSTADDKCRPTCVDDEGRDAVAAGKTLVPINAIAWGVGAVGLAAGAFLFFTSGSSVRAPKVEAPTKTAVRIEPVVGLGYGGISGRF